MAKFKIPSDAETYINLIKERCNNLINHQIWTGIDKNTINLWFKNFKTEEEKYFAACILDNLIFRSKPQTEAMIFQLLSRSIPDVFRNNPPPIGDVDLMESLKSNKECFIRLVPVIKDDNDQTQSGYLISRLMKTMKFCNKDWIIAPSEVRESIKKGIKTFIFIDDFLGTGNQFIEVAKANKLQDIAKDNYIVFAPLSAHERGIKAVKEKFEDIKIAASEIIPLDSEIFSICCDDEVNTPEIVKFFYKELLSTKKIKSNKASEKYNLMLAYAFEHGVPNSSIKILYHDKNWNPLFNR